MSQQPQQPHQSQPQPLPPKPQSHIEQLARKSMREAFKQFDSDKSGSIQIHELAMLMKKLTQSFNLEDPTEDDINVVFREIDVNGDGKISRKEFDLLVDQIVKIVQEDQKEEDQREKEKEEERERERSRSRSRREDTGEAEKEHHDEQQAEAQMIHE